MPVPLAPAAPCLKVASKDKTLEMPDDKHQIRLVTFKDGDISYKWPWYKDVKWTDDNKIGYVTKDDLVIYPFLRWWKKVPLKNLKPSRMMVKDVDQKLAENVKTFFTENVPNSTLFYNGLHAILHPEDRSTIFDHPIKLPILTAITTVERDARWDQMTKIIKSGDFVFCVDTGSRLSRFIAKLDHGTWSHTAWYIGGGYLSEAIPKHGVCVRHMEVYNTPNYRLGIYRPPYEEDDLEKTFESQMREIGGRYAYRKAIALGLKMFIGLRPKSPWISPNDMAIQVNFPIVHIV
jgi:hypothetical protein